MVFRHRACLFAALEVPRIFGIALALVIRILGICAQWPAPPRESFPRSDHVIWSSAFFHPIHRRGQQVEIVQCELATTAVIHAWHEKQAAPVLHSFHPTV